MSPDDVKDAARPCVFCGKQTIGSVGAFGLRWRTTCQDCKNEEDARYDKILGGYAKKLREFETEML